MTSCLVVFLAGAGRTFTVALAGVFAVFLAGAGAFAARGFCAGAFIAVGALPLGGGFPFGAANVVP